VSLRPVGGRRLHLPDDGWHLAALGGEGSASGVAGALARFGELAASMNAAERARLISLLVERVSFNRRNGTDAITFCPAGFAAALRGAA
jgi:hypothetical protein